MKYKKKVFKISWQLFEESIYWMKSVFKSAWIYEICGRKRKKNLHRVPERTRENHREDLKSINRRGRKVKMRRGRREKQFNQQPATSTTLYIFNKNH
jgi:hypothetical protein